MSNKEIRSYTTELRTSTLEDGTRTVSGFIPYNSPSVELEHRTVGPFTEVISPGAFAKAIQGDVLAFRDHDPKLLLGRTKNGTLQFEDTPDGLRYTIKLPDTTAGNDLHASILRGDLDGTSFGFSVPDGGEVWEHSGGQVVRTLTTAEIYEVSPCSFPAYPGSAVSLRNCPVEIRSLLEGTETTQTNVEVEAIRHYIDMTLSLLKHK